MTLSGLQITCANKNQNGTIVRIGGAGWSLSHREAIQQLLTHKISLYIAVGNDSFNVIVAGEGYDTYLVLESTGQLLSEVEQLLSC